MANEDDRTRKIREEEIEKKSAPDRDVPRCPECDMPLPHHLDSCSRA